MQNHHLVSYLPSDLYILGRYDKNFTYDDLVPVNQSFSPSINRKGEEKEEGGRRKRRREGRKRKKRRSSTIPSSYLASIKAKIGD